ncbi:MAG: hypothetical protein ACR2KZ_21895, partial [Segetibacter sp.]
FYSFSVFLCVSLCFSAYIFSAPSAVQFFTNYECFASSLPTCLKAAINNQRQVCGQIFTSEVIGFVSIKVNLTPYWFPKSA